METILEENKPIGKCHRCGSCCGIAKVRLDPTIPLSEAEYAMRRTGASSLDYDQFGHLIITLGPCPYLSKNRTTCLIYDIRPQLCREFPKDKNSIVPGCHYFDSSEEE